MTSNASQLGDAPNTFLLTYDRRRQEPGRWAPHTITTFLDTFPTLPLYLLASINITFTPSPSPFSVRHLYAPARSHYIDCLNIPVEPYLRPVTRLASARFIL